MTNERSFIPRIEDQQIPVPCRRCGGPMREHGAAVMAGPVYVVCPYCHVSEALPQEHAERVIALRARLAHLRAAREAEEAPSLAFAKTIEHLKSQVPLYAMFGLCVLVSTLGGAASGIVSALTVPDMAKETRMELWESALGYPAISLGLLIGVTVGYAKAVTRYDRAVAPTLRARAPVQPGMPARCRTCGAMLATGATSGLVACLHCGATNLLTEELVRDRVRLLEDETRTYWGLAAGVQARAAEAMVAYTQYFYIGGGVGLGGAAIFCLVTRLVIHLVFWFH